MYVLTSHLEQKNVFQQIDTDQIVSEVFSFSL